MVQGGEGDSKEINTSVKCSTVVNSKCRNALKLEEKYVKSLCTRVNYEDRVYCDSIYSFKGTELESLTVLKNPQSPQINQECLLGGLSGG